MQTVQSLQACTQDYDNKDFCLHVKFSKTKTAFFRSGWPNKGRPPSLTEWCILGLFSLNMIPWYSKRILCHCEGAEKCIFQTLFVISFWQIQASSDDATRIYWCCMHLVEDFFGVKIFFGAKICFRSYTIKIWGQMCPLIFFSWLYEGGGQPFRSACL